MGNQPEGWINNFKKASRDIYDHFLEERFGLRRNNYSRESAVLIAWMTMSIPGIVGGALLGILGTITAQTFSWGDLSKVGIAAAIEGKPILSPDQTISDAAKNCIPPNGSWQQWWGGRTSFDKSVSNYLSLQPKSNGVLYKHLSPPQDMSTCELSFIPLGDKPNYVFLVDGLFQIVIGDNDPAVVSLRANKVIDGPTLPVLEMRTTSTRPRLKHEIKQGSDVRVRITQRLRDDHQYEVHAFVTYTPTNDAPVSGPEEFAWVFIPSPQLQLSTSRISVGLIRGKDDKGDVSVDFLTPNPLEHLIEGASDGN